MRTPIHFTMQHKGTHFVSKLVATYKTKAILLDGFFVLVRCVKKDSKNPYYGFKMALNP